jgi:hypothetical protein
LSKGKSLVGKMEGETEILSREEVLQILSEQARKGSVSAAVALERCLRPGDTATDSDWDSELERILTKDD